MLTGMVFIVSTFVAELKSFLIQTFYHEAFVSPTVWGQHLATFTTHFLRRTLEEGGESLEIFTSIFVGAVYSARSTVKSASTNEISVNQL